MTVVVGYLAGKCGKAVLNLAVEAAITLKTSLAVTTVVPRPWLTPSPAKVDAEYAEYSAQLAAASAEEAARHLGASVAELDISYHMYANRSVSGGLMEAVTELKPHVLVLGSASDGQHGQVVVGSTADRLLHSSPVPLAISPRGYRSSGHGLTGLSVGYPGTPDSVHIVQRVASLATELNVPLRVLTFAVRGRTMYPPEVGLHAEDSVLEAWAGSAREAQARLKTDGIVGPDVELEVVTGNGWASALDAADWKAGEILALGTTRRSGVVSVFLGSKGTKIIRHSPVPVLVLPA